MECKPKFKWMTSNYYFFFTLFFCYKQISHHPLIRIDLGSFICHLSWDNNSICSRLEKTILYNGIAGVNLGPTISYFFPFLLSSFISNSPTIIFLEALFFLIHFLNVSVFSQEVFLKHLPWGEKYNLNSASTSSISDGITIFKKRR